ncbi:MAG: hypothetical protein ABFC77_11850 [Thermoguttaceae bacterium]
MREKLLAHGDIRYRKALESEYRKQLADLQVKLKSAEMESRRLEIVEQIARLTETHREQLRTIGRSLF